MGGTHPGKGDDEQSYREPPGFCTVGKDTGSDGARPWGSNLAPTVLVMEPVTTHCNCSLSEPDGLFPGPLQTAAEETQVPFLGHSASFTNVPTKTTRG